MSHAFLLLQCLCSLCKWSLFIQCSLTTTDLDTPNFLRQRCVYNVSRGQFECCFSVCRHVFLGENVARSHNWDRQSGRWAAVEDSEMVLPVTEIKAGMKRMEPATVSNCHFLINKSLFFMIYVANSPRHRHCSTSLPFDLVIPFLHETFAPQ